MNLRERNILNRFSRGRLAVVGDIMLDTYLWGQVTRISPEAPVPVVSITSDTSCLGGAANVMRNLATLGAEAVHAFGVTGCDRTADSVFTEFTKFGIVHTGVERDPKRRTTEKRRVMAGAQQLLREDFEDIFQVDDSLRRHMVTRTIALIREHAVDAVIFEDYAKGVLASWMLEEIVAEAVKNGIPTALDPKPGNLTPVQGLTVMKPNRPEAFALAGLRDNGPGADNPAEDPALLDAAAKIAAEWNPENLLLSLAAQGLGLFRRDAAPRLIPTRAQEVFDVSGAGDTVTAAFVLSLVSGATPEEAAELANRAAGAVVGKIGTVPIYLEELQKALEE